MPVNSGELKDVTTTGAVSLITFASTAAQLVLLNGMLMGTSASTRIGRRITVKSIYLRYWASLATGTTGTSPIRIMIVLDKQANTQAPAAGDILLADNISQPNNLSNSRRFVTLCDKVLDGIGTVGKASEHFEFYKKTNLEVQYNTGNAGTVADIQSGSLYLLVWSTGAFGTTSPTGGYTVRLRFTD